MFRRSGFPGLRRMGCPIARVTPNPCSFEAACLRFARATGGIADRPELLAKTVSLRQHRACVAQASPASVRQAAQTALSRTGSNTHRRRWSPAHTRCCPTRHRAARPNTACAHDESTHAARSDQMCQSRDSFASASVERLTGERKTIACNLGVLADRLASTSRRLSRQLSGAKAMAPNCSAHDKLRTPALPESRCPMRVKLVHGTNSMIRANGVLPAYPRNPRGCQPREAAQVLTEGVQVGTKPNQPAGLANASSRSVCKSFNQTARQPRRAVAAT